MCRIIPSNQRIGIVVKIIRRYPLTIIYSIVVIAFLAAYFCKEDTAFLDGENRYLTTRPDISLDGIMDASFMKSFESYTEDQLYLREAFIELKSLLETACLKQENNGIVCGKNGYLFEKLMMPGKQINKNEAAIKNFADSINRDVNVCIVPNSIEINRSLAPVGLRCVNQKKEIDSFYNMLADMKNVNVIDVYSGLAEHSDEYIYYKTDHHWTTLGAYYGYADIIKSMNGKPVEISTLANNSKQVNDFYGTFNSKYKGIGIEPDVMTYYDIPVESYTVGEKKYDNLYDFSKLDTYDKYAMFLYGNEGISVIKSADSNNSVDEAKRLVVFKDSYANCMIPFMTYNYDEIIVVDLRFYGESVSNLLQQYEDADVLLMYNFSFFNEDNHIYRLTS